MPDVGRSLSFLFLVFSLHDSLHLVIGKESIRLFGALLNGRIMLRIILKKYDVVIELAQFTAQSGLLWTV
jgi:hypothetical protein